MNFCNYNHNYNTRREKIKNKLATKQIAAWEMSKHFIIIISIIYKFCTFGKNNKDE